MSWHMMKKNIFFLNQWGKFLVTVQENTNRDLYKLQIFDKVPNPLFNRTMDMPTLANTHHVERKFVYIFSVSNEVEEILGKCPERNKDCWNYPLREIFQRALDHLRTEELLNG